MKYLERKTWVWLKKGYLKRKQRVQQLQHKIKQYILRKLYGEDASPQCRVCVWQQWHAFIEVDTL